MHNRKSHKDASCAFMDGWKVQAVSCAVIFLEILRSAAKEQQNSLTEPTADKFYWWRGFFFVQRLVFYTSEEAERRGEIDMMGELEWNKFISVVLFQRGRMAVKK